MVRLIAKTATEADIFEKILSPEEFSVYVARVSNPQNQLNLDTSSKLIEYCVTNLHWSILEHVYFTYEIEAPLPIITQILRHRSFTFQQFSARYADPTMLGFDTINARRQDVKNRQNSIDDLSEADREWFNKTQNEINDLGLAKYKEALSRGIAKECARFLLPQTIKARIYMTGSARSWVHYLQSRTDKSTQFEHRQIAEKIKRSFIEEMPSVSNALGWKKDE